MERTVDLLNSGNGLLCNGAFFVGSRGIWIYRNSDMKMEDTLNAAKNLDTVVGEVREIVSGKDVASYNVKFDFGKFLYREPWDILNIVTRKIDIMKLATSKVYERRIRIPLRIRDYRRGC